MVIHFGVIGCGDVAFRTYFPALLELDKRGQVSACFDPIPERAERAAALFPGARAFTTYEEFLAFRPLNAVFNLTPAPLHRETTGQALDVGLHVFTEKPLAATVAEGEALIRQSERLGLTLFCAPAISANQKFRWIKRLLDDGKIGRPTLATSQMGTMGPAGWREYTGDPAVFYAKGVGPVLDLGVYALHAITGLFGPAKRVQAFGGIAIPERDVLIDRLAGQKIKVTEYDNVLIHLDFGENVFAQLLASFAIPKSKAPGLEIHGSGGSISISMANWYDARGPVDVFIRDESSLGVEGWMDGVRGPNQTGPSNLIAAGPHHFLAHLLGEEEPILTARHGLHVLEIMRAADRSVSEGRVQELSTRF